ncbi:MAG: alanine dehydrogenase [Chitinophagaceae bacterium]|nr:MAG: alanine dehydrogenase [Chitinophagaceae bacterium]
MLTLKIGLIREGKVPADNRVALTPAQCRWIHKTQEGVEIFAQSSDTRCFPDKDYELAGVKVVEDISHCDILFGIKEVPVEKLIEGKTYLFFSHTKKLQSYNQHLLQEIIRKKITLVDYECLEHEDGTRIIGFGFFAGIVGAHNGMRAYGNRTGAFLLDKVNSSKNLQYLIHTYFGLAIPNIKIAITGSGRVAHGLQEIMNLMGIHEVEPDEFLEKEFSYPVYVQLKGANLYENETGGYNREEFHAHPEKYRCKFAPFLSQTDILMNGIYWDKNIPRLFEMEDMRRPDFRIKTIADVTDDYHGSVPCNLGDSTIEDPVYGVDRITGERTGPFLPGSVDVMAVGNLPNELPRDASRYFGEQLIKFVLGDILKGGSEIINRASIVVRGELNAPYEYMRDYAEGSIASDKGAIRLSNTVSADQ